MEQRSLNGLWEFGVPADGRTDFAYRVPVPGSWRDLPELADYEGIGRYRTRFDLSEADLAGQLWIRFAGVWRHASVFLNGTPVCVHDGFQAPVRASLLGAARAGENVLEVQADSRRAPGEIFGSASVFELVPFRFDGLFQPVTLECAGRAAVTGAYLALDAENDRIDAFLDTESRLAEPVSAEIRLLLTREGEAHAYQAQITLAPGVGEARFSFPADGLSRWTPEAPALYRAEIELCSEAGTDVFSQTTGFKQLACRGREFYLNGAPCYLPGYGDDCVFPEGRPSADDPDTYRYGLRRAKAYGFRYARHHSHFPMEAFLTAADEEGLLIQPELALANVSRDTLNEENSAIFFTEWEGLIRGLRHHPCIAFWCAGNEMEWGYPFDRALYETAKRLDPYRPAMATDGNFLACDTHGPFDLASVCPSEYTDYLPYGELSRMFLRDENTIPQVVHEMGNYTTVHDFRLIPRLHPESSKAARRLQAITEERGWQDRYAEAYANSLSLQRLCHKLNVEKARLSPCFAGYHLWTLTDFYNTTQGLLDPYFGDKAFCAEEFSEFNRESVLLWDTETVCFPAGRETELAFRISRYGSDAPFSGTLTLALSDGQSAVFPLSAKGHGLLDAARWRVRLPECETERMLTLTASLDAPGLCLRNRWTLFSVPEVEIRRDREIYIHYLARNLFEDGRTPVRHFTIPQPIGPEQLIVTGFLYGGMTDAVERGTNMLLLAGPDTFRETVTGNAFKSAWWEQGHIWYLNHANNDQISCTVAEHPANASIPYRGAWQLDLFHSVEQAPAVNIDALGLPAEPILYGYNTKLERLCYLFALRIGKGAVLVSTLHCDRAALARPEAAYHIRSLVNFCMSDRFAPKAEVSAEDFRRALK